MRNGSPPSIFRPLPLPVASVVNLPLSDKVCNDFLIKSGGIMAPFMIKSEGITAPFLIKSGGKEGSEELRVKSGHVASGSNYCPVFGWSPSLRLVVHVRGHPPFTIHHSSFTI